jgi:hypothetical protein
VGLTIAFVDAHHAAPLQRLGLSEGVGFAREIGRVPGNPSGSSATR